MESAVRFDLRPAANQYVRAQRGARVFFLLLGSALGGFDVYNLITTPLTSLEVELSIIAWATAVVLWWEAGITLILPPIELRIDSSGWAFVAQSGWERRYRWDDPRLKLGFVDARGYPSVAAHPDRAPFQVLAEVGSFFSPKVVLSSEAFDGLLTAATNRGVTVTPSDWNVPTQSQRVVVVTNRG